jgi:hypothetical protein
MIFLKIQTIEVMPAKAGIHELTFLLLRGFNIKNKLVDARRSLSRASTRGGHDGWGS